MPTVAAEPPRLRRAATSPQRSPHRGAAFPSSVAGMPHGASPSGIAPFRMPATADIRRCRRFHATVAALPSHRRRRRRCRRCRTPQRSRLSQQIRRRRPTHVRRPARIRAEHSPDARPGRESCIDDPSAISLQRLSVGRADPTAARGRSMCPPFARTFPILRQQVHGKPLAWFDNAATTQKPQSVIDAISHFYAQRQLEHPPRRAHAGGPRDRRLRAGPRRRCRRSSARRRSRRSSSSAARPRASTSIAQTYGRKFLQPGDEIVLSHARASRQHRSLADDRQGKGGRAARHPGERSRRDHAGRVSDGCSARGRRSSR